MAWEELSEATRKELRNRELHAPSVSVYRWWARRSHGLIGALLDQAITALGPDIVVSDPMSGGGTVAVEAARRGLTVHAQDINPWAALGLSTVLEPVNPEALEYAGERLLAKLDSVRAALYGHPKELGAEIVCQLHVRRIECPACGENNYLYPTALLALDRRPSNHPSHGWYGCPACGGINYGHSDPSPTHCEHCGGRLADDPNTPRIRNYLVGCAHCATAIYLSSELLHNAVFVPALAQVYNDGKTTFEPGLIKGTRLPSRAGLGEALEQPIPEGMETGALRRMGFHTWRELYPERQLRVLDAALRMLPVITDDEPVARRLQLAISGFGEMAGYAARWDPRFRKVYELVANHHFSRVYLAAEVNPLGALGRGTLSRRIHSAVVAARWFPGTSRATVTTGSSERQPLPTESVDLVITDPPYFDSVQYGEISQGFLAFGRACGLPISIGVDLKGEAVPNRARGFSVKDYHDTLGRILRETVRTLRPHGRLLLTFHDDSIRAWEALAEALKIAGLCVVGLAIVHSENETDYAKRGRNAMTSDLIIECARSEGIERGALSVCGQPHTKFEENLAAMGCAISAHLNEAAACSLRERFHTEMRSYSHAPLIR